MNVDFSGGPRGGTEKNWFEVSRPLPPDNAAAILALPSAPRLVTGNLSPRDLEFYSSFRTILDKFSESWGTPLTAWLAPGNSDLLHF